MASANDASPPETAELKLYWNEALQDHLLTATETGETLALTEDYELLRVVGMVYTNGQSGTVPLRQMWHEGLQDHALVATEEGYKHLYSMGYVEVRVEGWVHPFRSSHGCLPLTTYWSDKRKDTVGVADAVTAAEIVQNGTYVLKRIEARILPPSGGRSGSFSPHRMGIRNTSVSSPGSRTAKEVSPSISPRGMRDGANNVWTILPPTPATTPNHMPQDAPTDYTPPPYSARAYESDLPKPLSRQLPSTSPVTSPSPPPRQSTPSPARTPVPSPMPSKSHDPSSIPSNTSNYLNPLDSLPLKRERTQPIAPPQDADPVTATGAPNHVGDSTPAPEAKVSGSPRKPKPLPNNTRTLEEKLKETPATELEKATLSIQRTFRGHQARRKFKKFKASLWDNLLAKAMENERLGKKIQAFEAAIHGLNEGLMTLGADPTDLAKLRQMAIQCREKYQTEVNATLDRREKARQRILTMKRMVKDAAEAGGVSGEPESRMKVLLKSVMKQVLGVIGLVQNREIDDALDSQQTAWQTEPVFKWILEGNFERFKSEILKNPEKMQERDHFGATPLLVALLMNKAPHKKMVRWLLEQNPNLAKDSYNSAYFKGEIALHFTIVHRDISMCHYLLECYPEGLLQRATGEFFQDREKGSYFGEWPLMFAVSTNQPELLLHLLDFGERKLNQSRADMLDIRDTDQNTLLHMCVWHNLPDMYNLIEKLCQQSPSPSFYENGMQACYNSDMLTPFTLAAKLGHTEIFSYLLEINTQETWRYGAHSYRAVFIDEIEPAGSSSESVLQILVDNEHMDLLALPLIRGFLLQKWNCYVKKIFMKRISMLSVYLLAFTIAFFRERDPCSTACASANAEMMSAFTSLSNSAVEFQLNWTEVWTTGSALFGFLSCEAQQTWLSWFSIVERSASAFVLIGAIWKGLRELGEMHESGIRGYFGVRGSMLLENILSILFCTLLFASYIAWMAGSPAQEFAGALSALVLWSYILWLMLGFKVTGPFIIMIWKMMAKDMLQFLVIFLTFQMGFTQAFHMLLSPEEQQSHRHVEFFYHLRKSFEVLLGQVELDITTMTHYPILAYILMVLYVVLVTILLLNLLIAMMSTTYSEIQEEADVIWNMEFSRLILSLESELTFAERQRNKYWSVVDGRRCFMLPMFTEEGKKSYWGEWAPNWEAVDAMPNKPTGWALPRKKDETLRQGLTPTSRSLDQGDTLFDLKLGHRNTRTPRERALAVQPIG